MDQVNGHRSPYKQFLKKSKKYNKNLKIDQPLRIKFKFN